VLMVRKRRIEQSRNPQQRTAREAILLAPGSRRPMQSAVCVTRAEAASYIDFSIANVNDA